MEQEIKGHPELDEACVGVVGIPDPDYSIRNHRFT